MRYISFLAIGLGLLIANPAVSAAAPNPSLATDISAAKKKKQVRHSQYVHARPAAARGWFDPSLGPDGKPYPNPYPPGTCSTDMGYGRFAGCYWND